MTFSRAWMKNPKVGLLKTITVNIVVLATGFKQPTLLTVTGQGTSCLRKKPEREPWCNLWMSLLSFGQTIVRRTYIPEVSMSYQILFMVSLLLITTQVVKVSSKSRSSLRMWKIDYVSSLRSVTIYRCASFGVFLWRRHPSIVVFY